MLYRGPAAGSISGEQQRWPGRVGKGKEANTRHVWGGRMKAATDGQRRSPSSFRGLGSPRPCRGLSRPQGSEGRLEPWTWLSWGHLPYLAALAAAFAAAAGVPAPRETATEGEVLPRWLTQGQPLLRWNRHYLQCLQSQELLQPHQECRHLQHQHQGELQLLQHLQG